MHSHPHPTRRSFLAAISTTERVAIGVALLVLLTLAVAGCKSKQEQAIEAAKQQAIASGQPQQVTTVDKNGATVVSVVRPPAPGQKEAIVTTTTVPPGSDASAVTGMTPTAAPLTANGAPASPHSAGDPVIQPLDVNIPAGTTLPIRMNQTISVKTAMAGDAFSGALADNILDDSQHVIVPRGTPVAGVVSQAHRRGHFKGASILSLRLTSMTLAGKEYKLQTARSTSSKKGKGKRTAALIGGGAGAGMLIGGLATGGVGLLVGGLAGGGAGTLLSGVTGNRDITIPAETIVRFKLADDLAVIPPQ